MSSSRASASRIGAFDLRPTQQRPVQPPPPPPPPASNASESLFVEDEGWEPVRDEDEEEEDNARLEWDHSADPVSVFPNLFVILADLIESCCFAYEPSRGKADHRARAGT